MKKIVLALFFSIITVSSMFAQNYKGMVELGFAAGSGNSGWNRGEVSFVNGIQFNDWLYSGVGVGLQLWQVNHNVSLPLFAALEATLSKGEVSPFANLKLGYNFDVSEQMKRDLFSTSGIYFNPSIGFKWSMNDAIALRFSAGYLLQSGKLMQNFGTLNSFSDRTALHALVARVGFEF